MKERSQYWSYRQKAEEVRLDKIALKRERAQTKRAGYPASGDRYKDLGVSVIAMAVSDLNRKHRPAFQDGDTQEQAQRRLNTWAERREYRRSALKFLRGLYADNTLPLWCELAEFDHENIARRYANP